MEFLYISRSCSPSRFAEYLKQFNNKLQQQAQKYNQLMMEGLVKNGATVVSVSTRPVNRLLTKQVYFKEETDRENGIDYHYIPFFNVKILRNLSVIWSVFFKVLFWKKKDTVVVCDALNIMASAAALLAATLRGFTSVGVVTDVPCHRPNTDKIPLHERINLWLMNRFKCYLLLTDAMSAIVNRKNRPYIVMEGHADLSMAQVVNRPEDKAEKKVCLYAGSLRKVYGIGYLVEGFLAANVPDTELHVYGAGDYANQLVELSKRHSCVKYKGTVPNSEIVRAEIAATLLINPRPSGEDYTKYSFPSKNMEYMASGTPVLTTKLPGMPSDHLPHVYLIEEETAEGIATVLRDLLTRDPAELHAKGAAAKSFILEEKNNVKQAARLLALVEKLT